MAEIYVNEGSALYLKLSFFDEDSLSVIPTTVEWRLDDITDPHTPVEVADWAALTPATVINHQVTAAQNAMLSQDNNFESRLVTIKTDGGLSTQGLEYKSFLVKNLHGHP